MKKKILALVLCVAMLAIAVVGGTLAYFTDTDAKTNVVTVGSVSADLYESRYHRGAPTGYLSISGQPNPTSDADIIYDADNFYQDYLNATKLMPFNLKSEHRVQSMFEECTVAKNAYVKNTGNNDCFVRVRYIIPENIAPYLDIFYVDSQFITAGNDVATTDARTLNNADTTEPMITTVNSSGANFTLQGTKYIYEDGKGYYVAEFIYAERLTPGEMTLYSPISKITLIPTVTEDTITALNLTNRQFNVEVKADVIQADGFFNAVEAFAAFDAQ